MSDPDSINYMDVAPHQVVGISAALIPFLEHDDANRALMGSNMQAQAVPLIIPDIPMISTGMEAYARHRFRPGVGGGRRRRSDLGHRQADHRACVPDGTSRTYNLRKYQRSNQSTCIDQRPAVIKGQRVHKGDILADSSSTVNGKLALARMWWWLSFPGKAATLKTPS